MIVMARYNRAGVGIGRRPTSPLKTVSSGALTHEGGAAYVSDAHGELFRLGVNLLAGGEDTYYENGKVRDSRFVDLVSQLAVEDPSWTFSFLTWLRDEGNIRTASILGSVAAIHARLAAGESGSPDAGKLWYAQGYNRKFAADVPQRLDEVGEMFAIWSALYGKPYPQPLKRGAADALDRLANPYSVMKYDTSSHAFRVADVLGITHATAKDAVQNELYAYAVANRYGNPFDVEASVLPMIAENIKLREEAARNPKILLDSARLKAAGFTWEDALSLAGNRVPKDQLWNALILGGNVGYMAMLRNLRNFQEAGISKEATDYVMQKLMDPAAVAKSRQFPFRFWSAYKNATGTQWAHPLEIAIQLSTQNVPELSGSTLALIDTSGSMAATMSNKSTIRRDEAAAVFAAALAQKNPNGVDLHMFADGHAPVRTTEGGSILRIVSEVTNRNGEVGWGTQTVRTVQRLYNGHDRVMIFTDGQSFGHYGHTIDSSVPAETFVYGFDLAGYEHFDVPSGNGTRHQLAGLTDGTFRMIPLLERGRSAAWPWED